MQFTFREWNLIHQAVRNWAENSEEQLKNSKPSDEPLSMYQIFLRQSKELRELEAKISNSII